MLGLRRGTPRREDDLVVEVAEVGEQQLGGRREIIRQEEREGQVQ